MATIKAKEYVLTEAEYEECMKDLQDILENTKELMSHATLNPKEGAMFIGQIGTILDKTNNVIYRLSEEA